MVPEAGGSSSFGRRAFNEFVSFGAGWALMLDYIVTVAISAYFVPNYLAVFWPALKTLAVQLHRRHRHHHRPGGASTSSASRRRRASTSSSRCSTSARRCCSWSWASCSCSSPRCSSTRSISDVAPTWSHLIYGISIGTIAYTGIETVSNMSEEAANPDRDVPRAINFVLIAVLVVYLGISMTALSAMPVKPNVLPVDAKTGQTVPRRGRRQEHGRAQRAVRVQGRAAAGQRRQRRLRPGGAAGGRHAGSSRRRSRRRRPSRRTARRTPRLYGSLLGSVYKEDPVRGHRALPARRPRLAQDHPHALGRHPGRDHPAHRHERRAHRRVAAGLLARAAPPGAARSSAACTPSGSRPTWPSSPSAPSPASCCCYRATRSACSPTCTPSAP